MNFQRIKPFLFILVIIAFNVQAQAQWPGKEWEVATPKSQGMNADSLKILDDLISSGRFGNVDAMVITRNGKLIYKKKYPRDYYKIYGDSIDKKSALNPHDQSGQYNYFNPWWHPYYRREAELHSLQSVSKTITSVIIGVAINRKDFPDISTPVLSFFDANEVKNIDDRKKRLTIKHLLTMTAGFDWNESVPYSDPRNDCTLMEASFDWTKYVIDRPMEGEPGERFEYNSGATQLLSYIFRKATGKDLEEYAAEYLFAPLGIQQYYWKRIPTGLPDAEGGLYLRADDLAKIFYLFLKDGNWNGKEIVSKEWVKASITPSINVGSGVDYGYKWWLYKYGDNLKYAWAGSGFGGQFPIVIPEYNIVAVFNAWNITRGPSMRVMETIRRLVNAVEEKK